MFEKKFPLKISKKRILRSAKWEEFLLEPIRMQPFTDAGFSSPLEVGVTVEDLFNSQSADIHSYKAPKGLVLDTKGLLQETHRTLLQVIVDVSAWNDIIKIEWNSL